MAAVEIQTSHELEVRNKIPSTDSDNSLSHSSVADHARTSQQGSNDDALPKSNSNNSSVGSLHSKGSMTSKSLLHMHLQAPAEYNGAQQMWVIFLVAILPLAIPLMFCAVPLQAVGDGLWRNYTWWYQVGLDFIIYTYFICYTVFIFTGQLPHETGERGSQILFRTFMVYAIPHCLIFPAAALLNLWPVPFGVYLACGPVYLMAILYAYSQIGLPWIDEQAQQARADELLEPDETAQARADEASATTTAALRRKGLFVVAQFFAQAVIYGLLVGYRALFSTQDSTGQTIMIICFYPLLFLLKEGLGWLVSEAQAPGMNLVPVATFAFNLMGALFKSFLFPSLAEWYLFALIMLIDSAQMIFGLVTTSAWYLQKTGRTTSVSSLHLPGLSTGDVNQMSQHDLPGAVLEEDRRVIGWLNRVLFAHISKTIAGLYFAAIITVSWNVNQNSFFMFDSLSEADVTRGAHYAVLGTAIQAALVAVIWVTVRSRHFSPSKIMMDVLQQPINQWFWILQSSVNMVLVMLVLVKQWGCDFTFEFKWL